MSKVRQIGAEDAEKIEMKGIETIQAIPEKTVKLTKEELEEISKRRDFEVRRRSFIEDYGKLVDKYGLDLAVDRASPLGAPSIKVIVIR